MIRMSVEIDTAEHIDPLHAHEVIANHIRLRLSLIDWVEQVRFKYE